jgi:hypothetical protein
MVKDETEDETITEQMTSSTSGNMIINEPKIRDTNQFALDQ